MAKIEICRCTPGMAIYVNEKFTYLCKKNNIQSPGKQWELHEVLSGDETCQICNFASEEEACEYAKKMIENGGKRP